MRTASLQLDAFDPAGRLDFHGAVAVDARFQRLDFHNRPISGHGKVQLTVHATAYAVAPLTVDWATR
jgi:hypothetical protein